MEQLNKLRENLLKPLPGEAVQYLMAPENRSRIKETERMNFRPSAVLILLCKDADGWYVPLIQRHSYDGAHSAQVSLPGGKADPTDKDLQATALRECSEEIGISDVEVLGSLSPLHIPVSGFMVQPFVGVCLREAPQFVPHVREVEEIFTFRPQALWKPESRQLGYLEIANNLKIKTPWYELGGKKVWGATAMILSEFSEVYRTTL